MPNPKRAMNVTVMVPAMLKGAVEGRKRLDLGVPSTADVGDILETLFKLYPKLVQHVAHERDGSGSHFNLFWVQDAGPELSKRPRLRDGLTLYLCASSPKRLAAG